MRSVHRGARGGKAFETRMKRIGSQGWVSANDAVLFSCVFLLYTEFSLGTHALGASCGLSLLLTW